MTQTTESPIIFSGDMVKAILANLKTQTRMVVKALASDETPANQVCEDGGGNWIAWYGAISLNHDMGAETKRQYPNGEGFKCPYGKSGDRLCVRETWCQGYAFTRDPILYRADYEGGACHKWNPSSQMPRKYSRILLEVVSVRVERLQEITEADAIAEGCTTTCPGNHDGSHKPTEDCCLWSAANSYQLLWNSINGKKSGCSWADNPFVWVVEFKRLDMEGTGK
jgi:hypothetical protein